MFVRLISDVPGPAWGRGWRSGAAVRRRSARSSMGEIMEERGSSEEEECQEQAGQDWPEGRGIARV